MFSRMLRRTCSRSVSARPSSSALLSSFNRTFAVSIEEAGAMPKSYSDFSNETLIVMAVDGDYHAKCERLIRDIMSVDQVEHSVAKQTFKEMVDFNRSGRQLLKVPYYVGFTTAVGAAVLSTPMIFDLETVLWFNKYYVTTEVPGGEDLETALEVGSWAWNWMEPPLGQASFVILCLQFARGQLQNMEYKPYTGWMKAKRANRLANNYPQYHSDVVLDFADADVFNNDQH